MSLVVADKFKQIKANPLVKIEMDARSSYLSAMRLLGLAGDE
jgi:phage terminase small subunit